MGRVTDSFSEVLSVASARSGVRRAGPTSGGGFLYGGLRMAVALSAAASTVGRALVPMSMRTAFLSFGTWGPMEAEVGAVHDGRTFVNRSVLLHQQERRIAASDVSFHLPEEGPERQHHRPPEVPEPETLDRFPTVTGGLDLMELRPVRSAPEAGPVPPGRMHPYWARVHEDLGSSPAANAAAVSFLSDYMVIFTPFDPGSSEAAKWRNFTLEHTIWFHYSPAGSDWLLFDAKPLIRAGGRYVTRGTVHDRRGRLVASFVQEGISRPADRGQADPAQADRAPADPA